jgi:hypothetical protein
MAEAQQPTRPPGQVFPTAQTAPQGERPADVPASGAAVESETPQAPDQAAAGDAWKKPLPLSLTLEYCLVSDYVFRGFNYSEYPHEGREMPNHQLSTTLSLDLAPLWGGEEGAAGSIGFNFWSEWYAGQEKLTGEGCNNQENDYTLSYSYDIAPIATTATVSWLDYVSRNVRDTNDDRTNEWSLCLEHNDAWAYRWLGYQGEEGILNPMLAFYQDMHTSGGTWLDLGVSHDFEVVKNLTITPSYTLNIDGGYWGPQLRLDDHDTRIAGMTWGLNIAYDMTELLRLPSEAGSITISGFLDYFNPTSRLRRTLDFEDQLWGGVKLAWSW